MRNLILKIALLGALLLLPFLLYASDFYSPEGGVKDMDALLAANPLREGEEIRSTLLSRSEASSVHLIQVRGAEKPHIHRDHDLIVFLKKGKGILYLGGKKTDLKEGDGAFIPKGVPHQFVNTAEGPAAGIGIFVPAYDGKDNIEVK